MYAMVNSAINKISTFVPASILVVGLVIGLALPAKAGKVLDHEPGGPLRHAPHVGGV